MLKISKNDVERKDMVFITVMTSNYLVPIVLDFSMTVKHPLISLDPGEKFLSVYNFYTLFLKPMYIKTSVF